MGQVNGERVRNIFLGFLLTFVGEVFSTYSSRSHTQSHARSISVSISLHLTPFFPSSRSSLVSPPIIRRHTFPPIPFPHTFSSALISSYLNCPVSTALCFPFLSFLSVSFLVYLLTSVCVVIITHYYSTRSSITGICTDFSFVYHLSPSALFSCKFRLLLPILSPPQQHRPS